MSYRHSDTRTHVARAAPPIPVACFLFRRDSRSCVTCSGQGHTLPTEETHAHPLRRLRPLPPIQNNRSIFRRVTASWNLFNWKYHPAQVRTCDLRVHTESSELQYKHVGSTAPPLSFMCSFPVWVCMHACPQSKLCRHDVNPHLPQPTRPSSYM